MEFTAHDELQLFALLLAFGVILIVAARSRLPVSVFLVTGGLLLGFTNIPEGEAVAICRRLERVIGEDLA